MRRIRTVTVALPVETDKRDGLAYTLWMPAGSVSGGVAGGVVILHGAGSSKESHHDFARAAIACGLGSVCFDQRGHGESEGRLDGRAAQDVATMAELLRERIGGPEARVALRGSSMGGYMALSSAALVGAAAVVAICPPGAELLAQGLRRGAFDFRADAASLDGFLAEHDLGLAVQELDVPVLLLHAEGDERVPVQYSRELSERLRSSGSRLIVVPGGHHRSIQHDPDLQAVSLRFLQRALATG